MIDPIQLFDQACGELEIAVVKKILSNIPPPNAPSTVRKKGSSKTLVDTGAMVGAVTHRVSVEGEMIVGEVGIFDPAIAEYAAYNEFGTRRIPARPFLRSTWEENVEKVSSKLLSAFGDGVAAEWSK
ncbi:MAG: hypothetical protein QHG98_07435 [Methanothrix sp.]|nr:hypothetical protein [Methanothrix sp.]